MSLNDIPSGERMHIGFFGRRNAGKSSLVNAITNQDVALVSDIAGTTTDPVYKAMELLPLGPVMIVDTPGIDDEGKIGEKRVVRTIEILRKTDLAVLVIDSTEEISSHEKELLKIFKERKIPYFIVYTKADMMVDSELSDNNFYVSAKTGRGIEALKNALASVCNISDAKPIVSDIVNPGDVVVLVVPIDSAAPKGRLILPQQQVIRELLEVGAVSIVVKETELKDTLDRYGNEVSLVITDSQVFEYVAGIVPESIKLTSFSILMARHKGYLKSAIDGVMKIDYLHNGDKVLIAEGCTHHRQCEDIGTVKLPHWIKEYTGKDIMFEFTSGRSFPEDLSEYAMVIHCGGCMLNNREVLSRMQKAEEQSIAVTNYGIAIAKMKGILDRSVECLEDIEL